MLSQIKKQEETKNARVGGALLVLVTIASPELLTTRAHKEWH